MELLMRIRSISIHPPARGGTLRSRKRRHRRHLFQSTRPRGAGLVIDVIPPPDRISIHPPARGGTQSVRRPAHRCNFNPPARAGRDIVFTSLLFVFIFQSTRPRGAGLLGIIHIRSEVPISIHPPARGGTTDLVLDGDRWHISIHPPARGGTSRQTTAIHRSEFQSTRPRGAGRRSATSLTSLTDFNPPARAGRD